MAIRAPAVTRQRRFVETCVDWTKRPTPPRHSEALPGVAWGDPQEIGTPAFWAISASIHRATGRYAAEPLGKSLLEEIVACMLCGYGVASEVGQAYFSRLRANGLISRNATAHQLETALREPVIVGDRPVRYRFPSSKAQQLAIVMRSITHEDDALSDLELRQRLIRLPGIGPKTASFIVRNYRRSDSIAILDVHLVRAGRVCGIFRDNDDPQRNYLDMERRFLEFANAIGAQPSHLDNLMWSYAREMNRLFIDLDLGQIHSRS